MAECQHQGSTYIQVRLLVTEDRSTNGVSKLTGTLQARRTNTYAGETYQYGGSTSATININGTTKTVTSLYVAGGRQNVWQDQTSLTVNVSHTDAKTVTFRESVTGTTYFNGSSSGSINCAAFSSGSGSGSGSGTTQPTYTSPSIYSISASASSSSSVTVTGRVSSFGNGYGTNRVTMGLLSGDATSASYPLYSDTMSATTSSQSVSYSAVGDTKYKGFITASNGYDTRTSISSATWTPPPTINSLTASLRGRSIDVQAGYSASCANVAHTLQYRVQRDSEGYGSWKDGTTMPAGQNYGTFHIEDIETGHTYTIQTRLYYSGSGLTGGTRTATVEANSNIFGKRATKAKLAYHILRRGDNGKARDDVFKIYAKDKNGKARRVF